MKFILSILLTISFAAAQSETKKSPLESIYLQGSRDSYLLSGMLEHLKVHQKDPLKIKDLVEILSNINENLAYISQENYLLLIDTEMTKAILNFKSKDSISDLSGTQIVLAKNRLEKDADQFSPFVKSLYSRMLLDYEPFVQSRIIFNLKNPKYRDLISDKNRNKINLLNKYLGEKIYFFADAPKAFVESYVSRLSFYALKNMELASYAFKYNKPQQAVMAPIFTGLDEAKLLISTKQDKTVEKTVSPTDIVEKINVKEDPSPELDALIEDVSPNKN